MVAYGDVLVCVLVWVVLDPWFLEFLESWLLVATESEYYTCMHVLCCAALVCAMRHRPVPCKPAFDKQGSEFRQQHTSWLER